MPSTFPRRARGIARIELALILAFMAFLLPVIFSIGRLFYVYAVLKQTAAAAAASLSMVPPGEWAGSASFNSPMKLRTQQLIEQSLLDANVAPAIPLLDFDFDCNGNLLCGGDRQDTITVTVGVAIPNGYNIMTELGMSSNMTIQTSVTVPYNH
ncbi:hypothetical protein PO883_02055 [Massilia sp. DJPM01]|uniref:hypothetical protein n=1 Tax=Massilia sp. DJPM01 TaxID=3024404 RepID=UPI00259E00FC|nr:hypothetical protein [Massilia sp. DJPM01]MDM5175982.1 hypothetical protein [Massilia sp. DJPM01]